MAAEKVVGQGITMATDEVTSASTMYPFHPVNLGDSSLRVPQTMIRSWRQDFEMKMVMLSAVTISSSTMATPALRGTVALSCL